MLATEVGVVERTVVDMARYRDMHHLGIYMHDVANLGVRSLFVEYQLYRRGAICRIWSPLVKPGRWDLQSGPNGLVLIYRY